MHISTSSRIPTDNAVQNLYLEAYRTGATGQVRISRLDGGLARAEKAIYYEKEQKVILRGQPKGYPLFKRETLRRGRIFRQKSEGRSTPER